MNTCPNGHGDLAKQGDKLVCTVCGYSFVPYKSDGGKTIKEVNQIIRGILFEARITGSLAPWQQEWIVIPKRNYDSGHIYKGINRWLLSYDNELAFLTKASIEKRGLKLAETAKARMVVAWVPPRIKASERALPKDKQDELMSKRRPFMTGDIVYRSKDVIGLPEKTFKEMNNNEKVSSIEEFIKSTGITIKEGGNKASYRRWEDAVYIPDIRQYSCPDEYYRDLLHEIAHATGHKDRLNRDEKIFDSKVEHGKEELVAEMASAYMGYMFGIKPNENSVAYLDNWMKAIDADAYLLSSASKQAERVLDYFKLV